jgi:hypothetical protein
LARRFCSRSFVALGFGGLGTVLFSDGGGVVFEPVTPPGNGNSLGMVDETIQDGARSKHVAQEFTPFLQRPVGWRIVVQAALDSCKQPVAMALPTVSLKAGCPITRLSVLLANVARRATDLVTKFIHVGEDKIGI